MSKRVILQNDEVDLIKKLLDESISGYMNHKIYPVAMLTIKRLETKLGIKL